MVEAEGHLMVTLESPVTGEVVEVNQRLHVEPGLVGSGGSATRDGGEGGGVGEGWLVK
jgi:glycine cleavage system H lipoate-binding protein